MLDIVVIAEAILVDTLGVILEAEVVVILAGATLEVEEDSSLHVGVMV